MEEWTWTGHASSVVLISLVYMELGAALKGRNFSFIGCFFPEAEMVPGQLRVCLSKVLTALHCLGFCTELHQKMYMPWCHKLLSINFSINGRPK
jgi:hypothetical protein